MKKKAKPKKTKPKAKQPPVDLSSEGVTRIAAIPFEAVVKRCVKSYEETTGAKANQTRLIDFVRWCEDNSGLL